MAGSGPIHAIPVLENGLVRLEPANVANVELLIEWTFDPAAQGPYKRIPSLNSAELWRLFLQSPDRQYFLIRRVADARPLGRFYWRACQFVGMAGIDWELNIFLADPGTRGKGYGTAVQQLASDYLMTRSETRSVFAFTLTGNLAERRALKKAGFREAGRLLYSRYPIELPNDPCILFVREPKTT